ncbi:facilitated trehalose transporter Tret1-like [Athalia rosae]|uniref:facilitated trehalose transporter Tret1-like n=1 Tax=Athalia rosae TaxID=37344 RepID=UPI002033AECF|nr:facilitated trehalose transporter Tret1-like [Athalia rosae]
MEKSSIGNQIITMLAATLSTLCGGIHTGWTSPSLVKLQANNSDVPVTPDQGSWIASIYPISFIPGVFIAGLIVNRWGRKVTLHLIAIPEALAFALIIAAKNYWWLYIARALAGVSSGMTCTAIPMYLGEISEDRVRGALGVIINLMDSVGILLAYSVGPWVSRVTLGCVGLAVPVIFTLSFLWMPESPHFLVMKDKPEEAEKSLKWLLKKTVLSPEDLTKIKENVEFEKKNDKGTIKDLLTEKGNRKALLIVTVLMCTQQISGVSAIRAYTGLIFTRAGATLDVGIVLIIIGVVQFIGGLLGMFLVDHAGRKPLLLYSIAGCVICLIGEAVYFQLEAIGVDVSSLTWISVTSIVGYLLSYSIGLGCLAFVILSELFAYNVKTIATMWAIVIISVSAMTVTKLYQIVADTYGVHAAFWGFAGATILAGLFFYFVLPETKQKSFADIQKNLRNSNASDTVIIKA